MAESIVIRQYVNGRWVPYAIPAGQVLMPEGTTLPAYTAAREPVYKLVTINHALDGYPSVLLLSLQYGAGSGGAGDGPAGGTDLVRCPCEPRYHSRSSLTIYTIKAIAEMGTPVLTKISNYEYLITFDGISADSMYLKLLLNSGNDGSAVPAQLYIKQVDQHEPV